MSFLDKLLNNRNEDDKDRYLDDDYEDAYEDSYDEGGSRKDSSKRFGLFSKKVIDGAPQGTQLITIKPLSTEDCKEVCDYLLEGRIVVLNMEETRNDQAQLIINFILGAIYAIEGHFQSINHSIYVATPSSVEISGDFKEDILSGETREDTPNRGSFGGYSSSYSGFNGHMNGRSGYNGFRYND